MNLAATTEEELREALSVIDAETAGAVATAQAAAAAHQAAMATAGQEYNGQVADGMAAVDAGLAQYDAFLTEVQTAINAVQGTAAIIGSIGGVSAPGVPTGTPDCAAADVQAALGQLADSVNEVVGRIVAALTALDGAAQGLKEVAQQFKNQQPTAEDSEAAKSVAYGTLDGMF